MTDVYQSLAQLMPILEWYFENERPEALGERAALVCEVEPPNGRRVFLKLGESASHDDRCIISCAA